MITVKYRSRQVEIPSLRMSDVVPVNAQYSPNMKAAVLAAYQRGAREALKAQEESHGGRLEAAYFSSGSLPND